MLRGGGGGGQLHCGHRGGPIRKLLSVKHGRYVLGNSNIAKSA